MDSTPASPAFDTSRRGFLAMLGSAALTTTTGLQAALPSFTPTLSPAALSPASEAFFEWAEHLFETDGTLAQTGQLLQVAKQAGGAPLAAGERTAIARAMVWRAPNEAAMIEELYQYAASALNTPPNLAEILQLMDSQTFLESDLYRCFLSQMPRGDAALYLKNLSTTTPEQLHEIVRTVFTEHGKKLDELIRLTKERPELQEAIRAEEKALREEMIQAEPATPPRTFRDAAAARKVAMYPIPCDVSKECQQQLGIGLYAEPYASNCEHYGTVGSRDAQLRAYHAKR